MAEREEAPVELGISMPYSVMTSGYKQTISGVGKVKL